MLFPSRGGPEIRPPAATMRRRMATEAPIYDLTLLLDTQADDERRAKIVADVEDLITRTGGELLGRHDWGVRPTAYEINKRADAEYHLIQFQGPRELLERLDRTLRITDGVVRYRIIKLDPGTPDPPDLRGGTSTVPAAGEPIAADDAR